MRLYWKGLLVCLACSFFTALAASAFLPVAEENIYTGIVRLRVIANSDTENDQAIKYIVRDTLLAQSDALFGGETLEEAFSHIEANQAALCDVAEQALRDNGADYGATVELVREYYPTRDYESFTFPAGTYWSFRVVLGAGEGKNWWCVLFPALCNSAALKRSTTKLIGDTGTFTSPKVQYRIRFKFLEWFH